MNNEAVIAISGLKMKYGEKSVLKGIDLQIKPGQIISYIGPNGAGKTTTIRIILGMIDDYEGRVRVFDQDIAAGGIEYKKKIGYVPEGGSKDDTTNNNVTLRYVSGSCRNLLPTSFRRLSKLRRDRQCDRGLII